MLQKGGFADLPCAGYHEDGKLTGDSFQELFKGAGFIQDSLLLSAILQLLCNIAE
jgi:hypothetical protein